MLALTACTPTLAGSASPGEGWPDLAEPPIGQLDGRVDAALIVVIDDPALGGRPGAWEVGSGWWRYLVRTRGLRSSRVRLLRNEQASASAIADAVERMENQSDAGSMLWLIYIGSGSDGRLHASDGQTLEFEPLRQQLSFGDHESAFIVLDACVPASLPAPAPPPSPKPPLPFPLSDEAPAITTMGELAAAVAQAKAQVQADVAREQAVRRNTFVLTAGTGDACTTTLAGRPWPALAYAVLGGLQGWSDLDNDGLIAARELAIYAQALITEHAQAPCHRPTRRLEASGVDLILADVPGFAPRPIEPGLAARTDQSLREAATIVELELEDMVAVPRGRFAMGCNQSDDNACEPDEYPQHDVTLGGYAIDRTEVTWAAYRACMASGACEPMKLGRCWVWTGKGFLHGAELPAEMRGDDHPVVCVTWEEAASYCKAMGKRLPTEAEWERAARGVDSRLYPWGNEPPSCRNTARESCTDFTRAVGSYPDGASPVGALDMAGNVSEWISDWWHDASYARSFGPNPTGAETGEVRVVRGGSFYDGEADLRSSYRYGIEPEARISTLGFRCAR